MLKKISLGCFALLISVVWVTQSFALTHKDLIPFLSRVNLSGYVGDEPNGFTAMGTVTASREYLKKGKQDLRFAATIMCGNAAKVNKSISRSGTNKHVYHTKVKGFRVTVMKGGGDCTSCGAIMVHLDKKAIFLVNYEHISDKEALSLLRHFDLKAISQKVKGAKIPAGIMMPGFSPDTGESEGALGY